MTSCHWLEMEDEPMYDRTVLVYMAADNNLESFLQEDIDEMLKGAGEIPQNCRLMVYIDDYKLPRILSIEQQKGRRPVAKTIQQYTNEHDSGDTETLRLVMDWITENSPSESYGLVLWSHGSSWVPAKSPAQRAICVDSKTGNWMEIKEIADVLIGFPHLDFIMFDACFMQAIEVAYELRNAADYIISSPAEIPGPGAPYHRIITPLFKIPLDASGIVEEYYREYQENNIYVKGHEPACFGVCLSAIDCSQLEFLATQTKKMIMKYVLDKSSAILPGVQQYYPRKSNTTPEFYDMNSYMHQLITDPEDYCEWKSAFDNAVPDKLTTAQWFSDYSNRLETIIDIENYGGVSLYVPQTDRTKLNETFRTTSWYHVSGWDQVGW